MVSAAANGYKLKRGLKEIPIKNTTKTNSSKIKNKHNSIQIKQTIYKGFTKTFFLMYSCNVSVKDCAISHTSVNEDSRL